MKFRSAAMNGLGWLFGSALFLSAYSHDASADAISLQVIGDEGSIFNHRTQACEPWDVPDTPMRAYRGDDQQIHAFQTHLDNRVFLGPDFRSLRRICSVVYKGANEDDPAKFDDRSWVGATWTPDGKTVYAVIHNEYHGELRPATCPTRAYMDCWYNALTLVVSHDGGASFVRQRPNLIAAVPFRADQTVGDHAGYFEPSNVVFWKGAWYLTANVVAPAPQKPGNCLLQTLDITSPSSWRAWNGHAFETELVDPYAGKTTPSEHLCAPLDGNNLPWPIRNIVLHEPTGAWIAVMNGRRTGQDGRLVSGFFYSTSRDLVHWEGPKLFWEAPTVADGCPGGSIYNYPTLVDPASTSRNFETVGNDVLLTYVATQMRDCKLTADRDVKVRSVRIDVLDDKNARPQ